MPKVGEATKGERRPCRTPRCKACVELWKAGHDPTPWYHEHVHLGVGVVPVRRTARDMTPAELMDPAARPENAADIEFADRHRAARGLPPREEPAGAPTVKRPRGGVGEYVRSLIKEGGHSDEEIVTMTRAKFPASKCTKSDVNWNRNKIRKEGTL